MGPDIEPLYATHKGRHIDTIKYIFLNQLQYSNRSSQVRSISHSFKTIACCCPLFIDRNKPNVTDMFLDFYINYYRIMTKIKSYKTLGKAE